MHFNGLDFRENKMQFIDIPYQIIIFQFISWVQMSVLIELNLSIDLMNAFDFGVLACNILLTACVQLSLFCFLEGFPWYFITIPICTTCCMLHAHCAHKTEHSQIISVGKHSRSIWFSREPRFHYYGHLLSVCLWIVTFTSIINAVHWFYNYTETCINTMSNPSLMERVKSSLNSHV